VKGALLGCILRLAAIGRAETPAAPGDFAAWPVPEIPVRTVVVAPMDPEGGEKRAGLEITRR
jgi:hypothetical protein